MHLLNNTFRHLKNSGFSLILADFRRVYLRLYPRISASIRENLRIYLFPVIFLFILFLRFLFYQFPTPKQENFETTFLITGPIYIESSQKVLRNSKYTLRTYNLPFCTQYFNNTCIKELEAGDILKVKGTRYYNTIYADSTEFIGHHLSKPLYQLKIYFINVVNRMLNEPYSSLLNGILLGVEPDVSEEYKNILVKSGTIHIIVVSGFNISVIFSFIYSLFSTFSLKKKFILGFIIAFIYCVIVGFEPPVMRALVMGTIVGLGSTLGRVKDTLYILFLTLLLLLIINPTLVTSVSLQLTFAATFGILVFSPYLQGFFNKFTFYHHLPSLLQDDLKASLAAQIFVFPLLLYYFKSVSLLGLIINPLVLWLIPFIMLLGVIFILLYSLGFWFILRYFVFILESPIALFNDLVHTLSLVPVGGVVLSMSWYILIVTYATIIALLYMYVKVNVKLLDRSTFK